MAGLLCCGYGAFDEGAAAAAATTSRMNARERERETKRVGADRAGGPGPSFPILPRVFISWSHRGMRSPESSAFFLNNYYLFIYLFRNFNS